MRISESLRFAHPVLAPHTGDFGEHSLELEIAVSEVAATGALQISCTLESGHPEFVPTVESGDIAIYAKVVCRNTWYNTFHPVAAGTTEIEVPPGLLRGLTQIRVIAIAPNGLDTADWTDLHPEFTGSASSVRKNEIIGLSEEYSFDVGLDKLRAFESIFRLERRSSLAEGEIAVDVETQYIRICAPPGLFDTIHALRHQKFTRDILLASVYLAAVMEVLELVRVEPDGFDDKWWFRVFQARCTNLGIDMTDGRSILKNAQQLLGSPLIRLQRFKDRLE